MKAFDIVAYTYQAEVLGDYNCTCMLDVANAWLEADGVKVPYLITEDALDAWATSARVDRYVEHTFDSGDFPKVIFADSVEEDEQCGKCGEPLVVRRETGELVTYDNVFP